MPDVLAASRSAPSRVSLLAITVLIILLCSPCLGLGGSVVYLNLGGDGRFSRWRSLSSPPAGAVALVTADPNVVYAEAADGGVYVCSHNGRAAGAGCWAAAEPPYEVSSDADFERSFFTGTVPPPPGETVDQLYVSLDFVELGLEARYAVLADGTVWVWEYSASSYDSLIVLLAGPVVGLALGLIVVGVLVAANMARRRRAAGSGLG